MGRRLRFYSLGLILGVIIVFLMFGNRDFSCNVMPNQRVLTEVHTKKIEFSKQSIKQLNELSLSEKFVTDTVLYDGDINFSESNAQKEPCPDYKIYYPEKEKKYYVLFTKCKENVIIDGVFLNQK
ncbi:MAG: hypothetical protein H6604_09155 [Flavobacteriales bacterium]|nr:hypothetical protein [Flavobacteriales bacterium]